MVITRDEVPFRTINISAEDCKAVEVVIEKQVASGRWLA